MLIGKVVLFLGLGGVEMPGLESVIFSTVVMAIAAAMMWRPVVRFWRRVRFEKARILFHRERERLEARLIKQIAVPVVTGEMEWLDCNFEDEVTFLRDRRSGQYVAAVAITLGPETSWAVDFGQEFRGRGVAVFRFDKNRWVADPKVYMNLTPEEMIRVFSDRMELVRREMTR